MVDSIKGGYYKALELVFPELGFDSFHKCRFLPLSSPLLLLSLPLLALPSLSLFNANY